MKDSVLRELAALSFSAGEEGEAAQKYALESLPKRYLKKYKLYLSNEIRKRSVTVRAAQEPDQGSKKTLTETFPGSEIRYETVASLGAGIELEHGDNIARINVKNIIERAINSIKESL